MASQNTEQPKRKTQRETLRLLALCALLCAPLFGVAPIRDAGYRVASRVAPSLQKRSNSDLVKAAEKGDLATVKRCLARGADIEASNRFGTSALLNAVLNRHSDVALYLVQQGANCDGHTLYYAPGTAFHTAVTLLGSPALVREMIRRGANANQKGDGATRDNVLIEAVKSGHIEVVRVLLEAGAQVNARSSSTRKDRTALMYAVGNCSLQTVELLLERGADPNLFPARRESEEDDPPLVQAISLGTACSAPLAGVSYRIVTMLLAHGADANGCNGSFSPLFYVSAYSDAVLVKALLDKGAAVDWRTRDGATALMYAASVGNLKNVKLLVAGGATVDLRDQYHHSALDYARHDKRNEVAHYLASLHKRTRHNTL